MSACTHHSPSQLASQPHTNFLVLPPSFTHTAYLVVADEAYGRAIPTAFLDKMSDEFAAKYGEKGQQAKEGSLTGSFG